MSESILVVEDDPLMLAALEILLEDEGYQVTTASSGLDAIMLAKNQQFDLVISDIDMPGMDGFSLAEAVRASGRWRDLPLIALSARTSADPASRQRGTAG